MEGTLKGFTLKEIFEMVAVTRKTGILEVCSGDDLGRAYFRDGLLYWAETDGTPEEAETGGATVGEWIEDAIMEIFEWNTDTFQFGGGRTTDKGGEAALEVGNVLADVVKRQAEWTEIRTEIPSMMARIGLIAKLEGENITLTHGQWRVVALAGKAATVEELRAELKTSKLTLCRTLYEMSKMGLVRCLAEIEATVTKPAKPRQETKKGGAKKYIRKSLLIDEDLNEGIPAEWAGYYDRLDSKHEALRVARAGAGIEH